jgi:signal transduction histidine kinase
MARMTKKLLNKTLRYYIVFALVVLVVSAPMSYFTTLWMYSGDTRHTLKLSKRAFFKYSLPHIKESDIKVWNSMNWNIKIENRQPQIRHDSIFNQMILDTLEHEDQPYRVLMTPIIIENKPYSLLVRMNMIESDDLIKSIVWVFMGIILLLFAGLYFITRYLSIRLWKPFYNSLALIEQFEIDKNSYPHWLETNIEEFYRLNQSVNKLIERNIIIYNSQKEFIENAAHELQTPLAVFQAKLDTLLQTGNITKDQAEIISFLNQSVTRLSRLNKNLLLLSKLDHNQYTENELLSITVVLEKQLEFFSLQAQSKGMRFTASMDSQLSVTVNSTLVDVLISNLLLNAVRHSEPNGLIDVKMTGNKLIVANSGNGAALDDSKIFSRFSKVNPSSQGSGLGLAIVKKIVEHYNWKLTYKWENNLHVFEVIFDDKGQRITKKNN